VWNLAQCPSGGRIRFKTDSTTIGFRAKAPDTSVMHHITLIGEAGFDIYVDGFFMGSVWPDAEGEMQAMWRIGKERRPRDITIHMPLYKPYRKQLDSPIADMKNLGYGEGGAITAALFLVEFVGDTPWAHIDMAGTALSNDEGWKSAGCSGFGARLLLQLALDFTAPTKGG